MKRFLTYGLIYLSLIACCTGFFTSYANDNAESVAQQRLSMTNSAVQPLPETPDSLVPPPPSINVKGYVLMDADTGIVIAQQNMNERLQPASLTKLMTLYLAFQALKTGQIHLEDNTHVSAKAWRMGGSRMFIKAGADVSIDELIRGIIVASGNDACVATAQYIAGTEETFTQMMNQTAERLGMKNTHYTDSTGLPHPQHYSTPYDMALLTRALIRDFPEYYHYFSQKWLTYNHIKQPNRNRLLWRDTSVDGLKTGHTDEAGYCLIASAKRNGMRLISILMGAPSDQARANDSEALLNYGFRFYKTYLLFGAGKAVTHQRVWLGEQKYISLGLKKPLYVTIPIGEYKNLKANMVINHNLRAPINAGEAYGKIEITLNGKPISERSVIALESDTRAGIFSRIIDHITLFCRGIFSQSS